MVFITEGLLCNACCCAVILGVPFGKGSQTLAQGGGRLIAEVLFKGSRIGISDRDIAWLHGNEFLVLLKIVVGRKDIGTNKLLLKDVDKVKQVLRAVITNVRRPSSPSAFSGACCMIRTTPSTISST